jgi:uncharacterized protein YprB with RNaseH-like and TPR domain
MTTPKRLFFDIETSPNIGLFWEAGWKKTIPTDNIIKERAIICICYKWQGKTKVHSLQWDAEQNDADMLRAFIEVANKADELVGHNGDRFDLRWIRTRCLFHRIDMFPRYLSIDTLKVARSKFNFQSNRLDYISKFLGYEGKIKTNFGLWKDILLKNSKKAMKEMVTYCCEDVVQLEKVFLDLSPHIETRQHHAMNNGSRRCVCPECGSSNYQIATTRYSAQGFKKVQLKCKDCYKYFTVAGTNLKNYVDED